MDYLWLLSDECQETGICITTANELIAALKRGIVVIVLKIDSGEIRVMPSTLSEKLCLMVLKL